MLPHSLLLSLTAPGRNDGRRDSPWPLDEDYWLSHCEGFRVDHPGGHFGVVAYVEFVRRLDRPDVVGVRTGRLGTRTVRVPVADVVEVRPAEERLVVGAREEPQPRGVMIELRSLLHPTRVDASIRDSADAGPSNSGRS